MTTEEAIKYLIIPTATSTKPSAEYLKQKEAYELAIKALGERPIHCKDCKYTVLSKDGKTLICCMTMKVGTVRPDFYCGNGEMKGGAE